MFVPTFQIKEVARDSSYFIVEDTTPDFVLPDTNPGGYGDAGAPTTVADVIDTQVIVQKLTATTPTFVVPANLDGTLSTQIVVRHALPDGVHAISLLYGVESVYDPGNTTPLHYTWTVVPGSDNLKLQAVVGGTAGVSLEDGISGIAYLKDSRTGAATTLLQVKSINATTGEIELWTPVVPGVTPLEFTRYYIKTNRLLTLNQGEGKIIKEIGEMAINNCSCNAENGTRILDFILLKLAAQVAFSCGNLVKANNAAQLLATSTSTPCSTC